MHKHFPHSIYMVGTAKLKVVSGDFDCALQRKAAGLKVQHLLGATINNVLGTQQAFSIVHYDRLVTR